MTRDRPGADAGPGGPTGDGRTGDGRTDGGRTGPAEGSDPAEGTESAQGPDPARGSGPVGRGAELARENRRLRRAYDRVRGRRYRRSALALAVLGVAGFVAGLLFPAERTVLFALGGIGAFGAALTWYLTPERFVPARVGERVYASTASTFEAATAELGLTDRRVYVPVDGAGGPPARLFVPQFREFSVPDAEDLAATFVVTADEAGRGLSVHPTGAGLFEEFRASAPGDVADDPARLADRLAEGLVGTLELADRVDADASGRGRISFSVHGSAYGPVDRFDHPVPSFLGVAAARGLDRPVAVDAVAGDPDGPGTVSVTWPVRGSAGGDGDRAGEPGDGGGTSHG